VLLFATGIGEAEVNKFDFVVLHHLHHVCDGLCHQILLRIGLIIGSSGMQFLCQQKLLAAITQVRYCALRTEGLWGAMQEF
jgi:hypothetical protein